MQADTVLDLWAIRVLAGAALGYLIYSVRLLGKDVKDLKDDLVQNKLDQAEDKRRIVMFSNCDKRRQVCATELNKRIDNVCEIAKHHRHAQDGEVIVP